MSDLTNWGQYGKIVEWREYASHITLRCKNHPHLRWSTKNIAPIGARSLFYLSEIPECECCLKDLEPVPMMGNIL